MGTRDVTRLDSCAQAIGMTAGERNELLTRAGFGGDALGEAKLIDELREETDTLFAMARQAHKVLDTARLTNDYTDHERILRVIARATAGSHDPTRRMLNAQTWRDLGDSYQIQGKADLAEDAYRRAEEVARSAGEAGRRVEQIIFPVEFEAVRGQAVVARAQGDLSKAVTLSGKAFYIARCRPEMPRGFVASLRRDYLNLNAEIGNFPEVAREGLWLVENAERGNQRLGVALVKSALGRAVMRQEGRLAEAERLLYEALEESQRHVFPAMHEAMLITALCQFNDRVGNNEELLRLLRLGHELCDRAGLLNERRKLDALLAQKPRPVGLTWRIR